MRQKKNKGKPGHKSVRCLFEVNLKNNRPYYFYVALYLETTPLKQKQIHTKLRNVTPAGFSFHPKCTSDKKLIGPEIFFNENYKF